MDSNSIRWTQITENQKILPLLSLLENFLGPPLACWVKNLIGKNLSRDGCPTSSADRTIMSYWSLIFPLSSLFYRMWRHFSLDDLDTQKVPGVAECSPPPLAHPYCARKFTCHVMHRARAQSTKMIRADGHFHSFALGFNDLGRSVTPTFLFRNRFYLQLSPYFPKMNKKSMWEVKKISRFLSRGHRILPSCGCKARGTIVAKCELVLWGTSPVD